MGGSLQGHMGLQGFNTLGSLVITGTLLLEEASGLGLKPRSTEAVLGRGHILSHYPPGSWVPGAAYGGTTGAPSGTSSIS